MNRKPMQMTEQSSVHYCSNCGAPIAQNMPKCPYCGHIHEEGAERQFMQDLETTRRKLDQVDDEARAAYRQEWKKNSLSITKKVVIALVIIGGIVGLFALSEYMLFRDDKQDYAQEMVWQHEHFPELDALYEAGKYEEALELFYTYSGENHDMWEWQYYEEMMDYAEQEAET